MGVAAGTGVGVRRASDSTMPAVGGAESQAASASASSIRTRSAGVRKGESPASVVAASLAQMRNDPCRVPCRRETNDNCPLRHGPADCYIVRIRRSRESGPRHSSEGWNPGEGSDDRKCNQMQPNAIELKVSPLLATPPSFPCRREPRIPGLERRPLRVNQAKSGQIGPGYGGPPFLITPEKLRTPEVGKRQKRAYSDKNAPPQIPSPSGRGSG